MDDYAEDADFCQVPLAGLRDEGPLVLAAGWLNSAEDAGQVGECGPHTVVPRLYAMRFGLELTLHGCAHALAEARSCTITEQVTHDLHRLWEGWIEQRSHCASRLSNVQVNHHRDLWPELKVFHDLDPHGTSLRYPKLLPADANACELLGQALNVVIDLVDETLKCVPQTKEDCLRRLHFLRTVANDPSVCLPDGPATFPIVDRSN